MELIQQRWVEWELCRDVMVHQIQIHIVRSPLVSVPLEGLADQECSHEAILH